MGYFSIQHLGHTVRMCKHCLSMVKGSFIFINIPSYTERNLSSQNIKAAAVAMFDAKWWIENIIPFFASKIMNKNTWKYSIFALQKIGPTTFVLFPLISIFIIFSNQRQIIVVSIKLWKELKIMCQGFEPEAGYGDADVSTKLPTYVPMHPVKTFGLLFLYFFHGLM